MKEQKHRKTIKNALELFGLKENAVKTFLLLVEIGATPVSQISIRLNIPKSTIYDALRELSDLALVIEFNEDGKKKFSVNDLNQFSHLYKQKIHEYQTSEKEIKEIASKLNIESNSIKPKIRFFSGKEGMRQALSDILWYKDIETYSMWPMGEMLDAVGGEYLTLHNKERIHKNIYLKSIRTSDDKKINFEKYPLIKAGKETLREIGYTDRSIKWDMSFWIYGDKCIFASGGQELFAFIVHSKEFSRLIKLLWTQMWNICKKNS